MRSLFGFLFILFFTISLSAQHILVVGQGEAWSDPEQMEILRYFSKKGPEFSWTDGNKTKWNKADLSIYDIIWLHRTDSISEAAYETEPDYYRALLSYTENGGQILLTQHALDFLNKSGLEPVPVEHRVKQSEDNGYGRMLGFHAFREHPLFDSLHGGAYVWKPPHDTTVSQCGFFNDAVPENGKVIAVDWDYIFVRENSKLIVEYEVGKGKVLGIGAYFNLFEPNLNRQHFDAFYYNVFDYLTGKKGESPAFYWLYGDYRIKPIEFVMKRMLIPPEAKTWEMNDSWMALGRDKAEHEYCEVAGRRLLVAAYEPGGIFEVWAHPFMAFRDYKVKIFFENDTAVPLSDVVPSIEVTPESVHRTYLFPNGAVLHEVMAVSPDQPVGVIHYEYKGPRAKLGIQYKSNMRLMWPYSEKVLKTLNYGYQPGLNAIEFNAPEADLLTLIGANKIPVSKYAGPGSTIDIDFPAGEVLTGMYNPDQDTLFEAAAGQLFELGDQDQLDIIFAAGNEGREKVIESYMEAMQDPEAIYKASIEHYQQLGEQMLSITTPDENFNKGYAWAVAATDRFFVNTPGLGTSIVAGYNGTDRGWDGGHAVNGRPGYAWYFGRDAVWSAFAILDYGDYDGVKDILDMFIKYQDLNGKIYHELSTSGFVHYDASDATPLFIILAGRYLEQSGDIEYIHSKWPAILKAYNYCRSTDTDHDHLIENTNVGHGWVEGGHLFGSHSSLYLVSCWAEALWQMQMMSIEIGDHELADFCSLEDYYVNEILNKEFYNEETSYLYQGKYIDGSFHQEQSIMPSVPLLFYSVHIDKDKSRMLREWSGHQYSSDWGVRMASIYNPNYHPRGYHSGAVWPLYTGWVALAEYKHQRPLQGFSHIMSTISNYDDFALGYIEEVLNGEKYLPGGVCSHQCWSETMVTQPTTAGMLGIEKDVLLDELFLEPSIPFQWDTVEVKNLKIGNCIIDWKMQRENGRTTFQFTRNINCFNLDIVFAPLFMPGTTVNAIYINGDQVDFTIDNEGQGVRVWIDYDLKGYEEVVISHEGGISLVPDVENPVKGEAPKGFRIIDASWEHNTYTIEVEGAPAVSYELEVINNFGTPKSVEGAVYREDGDRLYLNVDFPALNRFYMPRTIKISF